MSLAAKFAVHAVTQRNGLWCVFRHTVVSGLLMCTAATRLCGTVKTNLRSVCRRTTYGLVDMSCTQTLTSPQQQLYACSALRLHRAINPFAYCYAMVQPAGCSFSILNLSRALLRACSMSVWGSNSLQCQSHSPAMPCTPSHLVHSIQHIVGCDGRYAMTCAVRVWKCLRLLPGLQPAPSWP